ncbi:MAG: MFS transporter [Chloroflexi bacterium]|nr:MFS transporter [Chloroflexota bacterium]
MSDERGRPSPLAPPTTATAARRTGADERRREGRGTVLVLSLAWLAGANCRAPLLAIGPLLPLIIADLHLSSTVAGALSGLPLLLMSLIALPSGLLADRVGPRRLLLLSQLIIVVAGGLRGLASGELLLLIASIGLGAGVGLAQPTLPQVARAVSQHRAGLATAVYTNGLMLGALGGVVLTVPVLLSLVGPASWRGVLVAWALLGLAAALGWVFVSIPQRRIGRSAGRPPMPLREVLAIPGLLSVAVVYASQSAIYHSLAAWLPTYQVAQGWSLAAASGPLVAVNVASIFGGLAAPGLALWWGGFRRPLVAASLVSIAGLIGLTLAPEAAYLWASLVGFGQSIAFTLGLAAPAELAPRDKVGAAAGISLTLAYLGSMLGPLSVGVLRDLTGGFTAGLAFLVASAVLCLGASTVRRSVKRET